MNYSDKIETLVDGILDEADPDERYMDDLVHEAVDSSLLATHHNFNLNVLESSYNDPEEWKHLVSDESGWRDVIQAMAYDVMRQDVYEELERR